MSDRILNEVLDRKLAATDAECQELRHKRNGLLAAIDTLFHRDLIPPK